MRSFAFVSYQESLDLQCILCVTLQRRGSTPPINGICYCMGNIFVVRLIRVSRSYLILIFFLEKSYFVLFFGKCPILSYFFGHFAFNFVFYSLFINIISHEDIPLKKFQPGFAQHQNTFCSCPAGFHFLDPFHYLTAC